METEFTPLASTLGGALIGLAAVMLMWGNGRIAGISGIVSRLLPPQGDAGGRGESTAFVIGLLCALPLYALVRGNAPAMLITSNVLLLLAGGLLVGFGTVTGSGCTSGHGVCGLSRLSARSLVATGVFMLTAIVTVYVLRHLVQA